MQKSTQQIIAEFEAIKVRINAHEAAKKKGNFITRNSTKIRNVSLGYAAVCAATGFLPAAAAWGFLGGLCHTLDKLKTYSEQ